MNVIFNGQLYASNSLPLEIENRALNYGDGLFETMIHQRGEILFLEDHMERLKRGLEVLKINFPASFKVTITEQINSLVKKNNLKEIVRVKLRVWRKSGGLFAPTQEEADYLITVKDHIPQTDSEFRKVDFCKSINLSKSIISPFKRLSSVSYVIAGIEMKERGLDDIILLDDKGNISECLYSNIFWIKNDVYYTPSLDTGCIDGIRRKNLLKALLESELVINIVHAKPDELTSADHIFTSNVAGLYPINQVGNKEFTSFLPPF